MLKASEITVGYGNKTVLEQVSVHLEPGTVTVLVGPNGSGKSTLLRSLAGALRPWKGSVTIGAENENLYRLSSRKAASLVAYVSQETAMPFAFTVGELVGLAGRAADSPNAAQEAIALMDLEALTDNALNTLSGGQQQRAAIARGLAQRAPCLLLDEPTAHLDLRYQASLFQTLRRRARESGTAVGVVLHDLAQAARHADSIVLLNRGQVEEQGTAQEVIRAENIRKVYGIAVDIRSEDSRIIAVTPADDLTFS